MVKVSGRPTAPSASEYLLLSSHTRQVLETDAGTAWKPPNHKRLAYPDLFRLG